MCRFLAYVGAPIVVDQLLFQPQNSLVRQSFDSRESRSRVNGDGFGVGWYTPRLDPAPAVFRSTKPAWNNSNLRSLASHIETSCLFAHVRDASCGSVTELNTHPFCCGPLMMMHNGTIGGFTQLKRALRRGLCDPVYNRLRGETDSEHFFALFLDHLLRHGRDLSATNHQDLVSGLRGAFATLDGLVAELAIPADYYLNIAVTNGSCLVAMRHDTNLEVESPTLYHSEGSRFECSDGVSRMVEAERGEHAVLIVSEKLTAAAEDWQPVPEEHLVVVTEELEVSVEPLTPA